jgi:hypothetical protein
MDLSITTCNNYLCHENLLNSLQVQPITYNREELKKASRNMVHPRDGTNTTAGIETAIQLFQKNGRKNVPWTCIVITDGLSKNPPATAEMAAAAKAAGKILYFMIMIIIMMMMTKETTTNLIFLLMLITIRIIMIITISMKKIANSSTITKGVIISQK